MYLKNTIAFWVFVFAGMFATAQTLTAKLDVSCSANPTPTEVRMTGPFWGWDPVGGPVATDNGDGTWSVLFDPAPGADMEYLWLIDGVQENLVPAMVGGGSCAPITDFASYANRLWTVGSADISDTYAQCDACGGGGGSLLSLTFDDASSVSAWAAIADANSPEATLQWNPTGVATGALDASGVNTSDAIGKAYIFEYLDAAFDYAGSSSVELSFDIKLSQPLNGAAVHLQTEFPGAGTINTFDIQNLGVNENEWTPLTFPFAGITAGNIFRMHFNIAAGAFNGAGGGILIDNIELVSTGTGGGGGGPVSLTVEVCDGTPAEVRMTGPFWGWDPVGGPVAADNGDGTWTVTLDPAPTENMEYLWVVDGVQENLIQAMVDGGSCAPVTDFANYANRLWTVGSPDVTDNTYGQCTACGASPLSLTVEFCDITPAEVRMTGPFWGWDPVGGPVASDNGDGTWTVVLDPAPGADMEYLWLADGVQENLIQAMIDGGSCAPVTDFANYANRLWTVGAPDINDTYGQCVGCGTPGCTDPAADNYDPAATEDDGSCGFFVSFSVDMNEYPNAFGFVNVSGSWNDWCADCNPLSDDDMDGVWTGTYAVPNGAHQFKYQVDAWTDQENLSAAQSCTITIGGFTNRSLFVDGASQSFSTVCWGSCFECVAGGVPGCTDLEAVNYDAAATVNDGSCLYNVTFRVDMNQYGAAYTEVNLNGSFNGWCGNCAVMTDPDLDGIFELVVELQDGFYEYKFTTDGFTAQEQFLEGDPCTVTNFGFTNRFIQVTGNTSTEAYCWNSCSACISGVVPGCTDTNAQNYNPLATEDDGSCLYNVTFRVDMSQYGGAFATVYVSGTFNGWSGDANPLADPELDNVWEGTVLVGAGPQEYKFQVDQWVDDEQFVGGEPCTVTNGGFTNRFIDVVGNSIRPVVCWEACSGCPSNFFDVTFRVDMFNEAVSPNGVHIAGSFQGWDPASTPMTYLGYGVYEFTVTLAEGETVAYKYINGNDFAGAEIVPVECGVDDGFGNFNRSHTVTAEETISVCFGECDACAGCTDPLSIEFNPFATTDDGSCATPLVYGCTYPSADNYNANANVENGSCTFTLGSDCPEDLNNDGIVNAADLLQFLGAFGSTCL